MKLTSTAFADGAPIAAAFAFCAPDPATRVALSTNLNPDFAWAGLPAGTRSLALICHDPDVPSRPDDVNKEGRAIPADLPRIDFHHWVLVDIPPSLPGIARGEFAGDAAMGGDYYGYDGCCPPWNDSIVHRYVFTLYALDVDRLPLAGRFTGADAVAAMAGHTLARASLTGLYSLNPALPARG
jgi:Raf kinase inhibitor-like YbhB/YbcL family protein